MRMICLMMLGFMVGGQAQEVQVVPGKVEDRRMMLSDYTGSGGCEVELRLIGEAAADTMSIRAARLRTATDDTGRDLQKTKDEPVRYPTVTRVEDRGGLSKSIQLKNPVRSANFIALLEGELDLFQPSTNNGGRVILKNFQAQPGQPLESPVLKEANILLIYVTKETEEAGQKLINKQIAKRSDAEESTIASGIRRIPFRRGSDWGGSFTFQARFLLDDPGKQMVDIAVLDATGATIETRGTGHGTSFMTRGFDAPLPADAQLVLYVATPASIKTVPFKLENIPLP